MSYFTQEDESSIKLGSNVFNLGATLLLVIFFFVGLTKSVMGISVSLSQIASGMFLVHLFWLLPIVLSVFVFVKGITNRLLHLIWFGLSCFAVGALMVFRTSMAALAGGFSFSGWLYYLIWIFVLVWNVSCLLEQFVPLQKNLAKVTGSTFNNVNSSLKKQITSDKKESSEVSETSDSQQ